MGARKKDPYATTKKSRTQRTTLPSSRQRKGLDQMFLSCFLSPSKRARKKTKGSSADLDSPRSSGGSLNRSSLTRKQVSQFKYESVRTLGSGITGVVFEVKDRFGEEKAMKTVETSRFNDDEMQEMRQEISILEQLDHPNVVRLLEVFETKQSITLIMDLCRGGSLKENGEARLFPKKQTENHQEMKFLKRVVYEVLLGLKYIHAKGIVHRDVKLDNILFVNNNDDDLQVKLIDFGFSTKIPEKNQRRVSARFKSSSHQRILETHCGTHNYMAPEMLEEGAKYGVEVDIWSLGVCTYILASHGLAPFERETKLLTMEQIKLGVVDFSVFDLEKQKELVDFLKNLLEKNVDKRWTVDQALQSEWLKDIRSEIHRLPSDASFRTKLISSFERFQTYGEFKKLGYMIIAHFVPRLKLDAVYSVFKALDQSELGVLSLNDFSNLWPGDKKRAKLVFGSLVDFSNQQHHHRNNKGVRLTPFIAGCLEVLYNPQEQNFLSDVFDLISRGDGVIKVESLFHFLGERYAWKIIKQLHKEKDGELAEIGKDEFFRLMES